MQTVTRQNTKLTTQKVRSFPLSGYLGSDLASGSVARCCHCCLSIVPVSSMSCSGLACCRHCFRSLVPVLSMSCSGIAILCVDFLAIALLTVTLSRLCLIAVLFLYLFHQITFPPVNCKKDYQYCNHVENSFVPSVY